MVVVVIALVIRIHTGLIVVDVAVVVSVHGVAAIVRFVAVVVVVVVTSNTITWIVVVVMAVTMSLLLLLLLLRSLCVHHTPAVRHHRHHHHVWRILIHDMMWLWLWLRRMIIARRIRRIVIINTTDIVGIVSTIVSSSTRGRWRMRLRRHCVDDDRDDDPPAPHRRYQ